MSRTACRREWIFRHRSSDDVPDVCPEGWWSWAGELLLGGAQLSDGRYYQWRFFMSQWVISFIEVIIVIVLSLTNCIGLVSLIYKNSVSKSVRVLWNAFMTLRSSGKCFKSCNFLFSHYIDSFEWKCPHKSQSWIPFVVIISSISAFTDWINQKEEFVKLRNTSSTTVSSEVVPELKPTTTGFPDNPQSTAADGQHLSTTPKESDSKNEEVM